ncbi:RidA family protein [Qaidamihabitans albus]|uniref:RidA family protein n=1 Tax=Qaidamihabitans albus TaxID=2795733 RepID=UPI0018F1111A|nr:RidA family protein [Qaidamihabitans albus]
MVSFTCFNPSDVPEPVGGYSQSVSVAGASRLLFISGQIPETDTGAIPEEFAEQCRLAWTNVLANLRAAGFNVDDLVKVTTYLTDRAYAEQNRAVRRAVLGDAQPSSTVVVVGTLDPRWLLEIEAIAVR